VDGSEPSYVKGKCETKATPFGGPEVHGRKEAGGREALKSEGKLELKPNSQNNTEQQDKRRGNEDITTWHGARIEAERSIKEEHVDYPPCANPQQGERDGRTGGGRNNLAPASHALLNEDRENKHRQFFPRIEKKRADKNQGAHPDYPLGVWRVGRGQPRTRLRQPESSKHERNGIFRNPHLPSANRRKSEEWLKDKMHTKKRGGGTRGGVVLNPAAKGLQQKSVGTRKMHHSACVKLAGAGRENGEGSDRLRTAEKVDERGCPSPERSKANCKPVPRTGHGAPGRRICQDREGSAETLRQGGGESGNTRAKKPSRMQSGAGQIKKTERREDKKEGVGRVENLTNKRQR